MAELPARDDPLSAAVAKAAAVYTPFTLSFYDAIVHGLSNRFAWRCPTQKIVELYASNLSANHLEAGVGTGLFIDRVAHAALDRLVLLDINGSCLARAGRRLARFAPETWQANLLEPLNTNIAPFDSVALTYVLHCLPGRLDEKLKVVDYLRPVMRDQAVLFGATILGRGIDPSLAAKKLLAFYNAKGIFNNEADDQAALEDGLRHRFQSVKIERQGCVALFRAR